MDNIVTEKRCTRCGETKPIELFTLKGECKKCKSERDREYRNRDKEKTAKRKKDYAEKNPDKIRAMFQRWRENNREKNAASNKKWASANPEKVKAAHDRWYSKKENKLITSENGKKWRAQNPEKAREQHRRWRKNNPELSIQKTHERRARIRNSYGKYTAKEWKDLVEKYNYSCLCCGRNDVKMTVDHVIPLKLGGNNTIENIQPLCKSCNCKKQARHIDYRT